MMQHKMVTGRQIAIGAGDRFEDRMKRIAMACRSDSAVRASADSPWLSLRVEPGREKAVKNSLEDADVEALVPLRKGPELRRRGRTIPPALIPVMACYVLVRCHITDRALIGLKSFDHVRDVLGGCASPRLIGAEEVRVFKAKADEGAYDYERPQVQFKPGEQVRISEGPFADHFGEIVSCRGEAKGDAVVEVTFFATKIPALIPLALLEKV